MENQGQEGPIKEWWEDRFRRQRNRKNKRSQNKSKKSCDKQQKSRRGKPNCQINANKRY